MAADGLRVKRVQVVDRELVAGNDDVRKEPLDSLRDRVQSSRARTAEKFRVNRPHLVEPVMAGRQSPHLETVVGQHEAQPRDLGPIDRCDDQYPFHSVAAQANERAAGWSLAIGR